MKGEIIMNKEYLTTFIEANESMALQSIDSIKNFNGKAEDYEIYIKAYSEVSKQHLNAIKQLSDIEVAEENAVIEYEKINAEIETAKAQREQELKIEIMNASKDLAMQLVSMMFYTARFREGLRYDIDNYVNDGFVRGLVQKLPDFMKAKK